MKVPVLCSVLFIVCLFSDNGTTDTLKEQDQKWVDLGIQQLQDSPQHAGNQMKTKLYMLWLPQQANIHFIQSKATKIIVNTDKKKAHKLWKHNCNEVLKVLVDTHSHSSEGHQYSCFVRRFMQKLSQNLKLTLTQSLTLTKKEN